MSAYKVPERVKKRKQREVRDNKMTFARDRLKFPDCIGFFPDDCEGVTPEEPGPSCKLCPYFKKR